MNPSHDPEYIPELTPRLLSIKEYEDIIVRLNDDPDKYFRDSYSLFIQTKDDPETLVPLSLFNVVNKGYITLTKEDYGLSYRVWILDNMQESFMRKSSQIDWIRYYPGIN